MGKLKNGNYSSELLQSRDSKALVDWAALQPPHFKAQKGYVWLNNVQTSSCSSNKTRKSLHCPFTAKLTTADLLLTEEQLGGKVQLWHSQLRSQG